MKLKTLKDITNRFARFKQDKESHWYIREDDLRQEAIKWIKSLSTSKERDFWKQQWFEFFNLTEEDLK